MKYRERKKWRLVQEIQYLNKREIWRTQRMSLEKQFKENLLDTKYMNF